MASKVDFNTLLVPVDFSPNAKAAFQQALGLVSGEGPVIIVLHVIDSSLPDFAEAHDLGAREEVVARMRAHAEVQLQEFTADCPPGIDIDPLICEGVPFLEILQKSIDFAVDAIVMGKIGHRGKMENLLFGSNAEKVIRGSSKPVLVLPPLE